MTSHHVTVVWFCNVALWDISLYFELNEGPVYLSVCEHHQTGSTPNTISDSTPDTPSDQGWEK